MSKKMKEQVSKAEKKICRYGVFFSLLFIVVSVFAQGTLSKMNIEVERLKKEITKQEDKNESLTMKVNELVSFDNVQTVVTELGLVYNNSNIKVIEG